MAIPLGKSALVLLLILASLSISSDAEDRANSRTSADLDAEVARVLERHGDQAVVTDIKSNLVTTLEVSAQVVEVLRRYRSAFLDQWLRGDGHAVAIPAEGAALIGEARAIWEQSRSRFVPIHFGEIKDSRERSLIEEYYYAQVGAAQAQVTAAADQITRAAEVFRAGSVRLRVVIPLLVVSDADWAIESRRYAVPASTTESAKEVEEFALELGRVAIAYDVAVKAAPSKDRAVHMVFSKYCEDQADRLIARREYAAAALTLRTVFSGEPKANMASVVSARSKIVRLYEMTGQPSLAALEMKALLGLALPDEEYGKFALQRLRYLYASEQFEIAAHESDMFLQDVRCAQQAAPILFIAWTANRRINQIASANRIGQKFIQRFPWDPLAATIYFTDAVNSVAEGKLDEARRKCQLIEAHFPGSDLATRAMQLRKQLEARHP